MIERWGGEADRAAIGRFVAKAGAVHAVGHRVVHGGDRAGAAVVEPVLLTELESLVDRAPLHQARALEPIAVTQVLLPATPAVASFDMKVTSGMYSDQP